jgi:fucose permease
VQTEDNLQLQAGGKEASLPTKNGLPLRQIGLCFGLFAMVGLSNGAIGVQLPDLRSFYRLDNAMVGLLYMGETLGYALAAFCSGWLVEWLGRRRFVIAGLVIFALSCLVLGVAPPFGVVLVSRPAIGFAMAIMESGANFFVASLGRTTLLNYLHAMFGAGSLVGPLVATFALAAGWGWNSIYLVWLGLSLPLLLSYSLLTPRAAAPENKPDATERAEKGSNLMAATLALPAVWLGAVFLVVYVGVELSTGAWAYTFLTEARAYDTVFSGWAVSGYWLGLTLGRIILAPLAERFGIGSRGLIQAGMGLAGAGIGVVWLSGSAATSALGLGLLGLGLGPIFPTTLAILSRLVAPRLVPSTIGFACSLSILGAAIFPALAGLVADTLGLALFMPYILLLGVVTVGAWLVFLSQAGTRLAGLQEQA